MKGTIVLAIALVALHASPSLGAKNDVRCLRNEDILWDGNFFGLWPTPSPGCAMRMRAEIRKLWADTLRP